jgi:hypothetical protein
MRDREYGGQRFWHGAVDGVARATNDRLAVRVGRQLGGRASDRLLFAFVLRGSITLRCQGSHRLATGDAAVVPAATAFSLTDPSGDPQLLEVAIA